MNDSLPIALEAEREVVFESLARAMWPRLVAAAEAILDSPADAEDVAQESLELAWRKWQALRDPSKREPWVLQICVRRALSWRRRRLLRVALWSQEATTGTRDVGSAFEDEGVARGFALCTARQRAVLVLHFFHGYTLDECAEFLGCRPGTSRSHFARALNTIRRNLS
ncbi:MAG: RNA polymerase sigma factor [Candidatus Dormibacteria bacterium]